MRCDRNFPQRHQGESQILSNPAHYALSINFLECNIEARFGRFVGMSFSESGVQDFGYGIATALGQRGQAGSLG